MAAFPSLYFNHISIFCLFLTLFPTLSSSSPTPSLYPNPNFDPQIDLFSDAHAVDSGAHVKLTCPLPSSSGLLLRRNPISLTNPTSFSTEFSFSISPDVGDGLLLVLVPSNFSLRFPAQSSFGVSFDNDTYLGVEFDTSMDDNAGDVNANHVGLNLGSLVSVAVGNVSEMNLVLNSGEKLKAWIDYDASSKRIETRLSRLGEARPFNPIIAYEVDLFKMWGGHDVFVGIASSNHGNSVQIVNVYSWKLTLRIIPKSLHSLPADPRAHSQSEQHLRTEIVGSHRISYPPLTLLAGVIFSTGCVTLIAFVVLFMWAIFVNRHVESPSPVPDFRISVQVENHFYVRILDINVM
ncbi:L-type lectin-domain containing receptor kinase VIII.1-like [Senna tora]|uniref:L-type lectin-domain containing receptor kinase VIII.1-like n=1 Tax=Senna tora TaxID=362788 RepID=A0A834T6S5_9FABA|nr:L-type lectin-domain containing receptor kinase VIII.1-like [Senna tora]